MEFLGQNAKVISLIFLLEFQSVKKNAEWFSQHKKHLYRQTNYYVTLLIYLNLKSIVNLHKDIL